jgi:hypothetical protein
VGYAGAISAKAHEEVMTVWGDAALLVELLDRQFDYLLNLQGTAQILRLGHLLRFLEEEPVIASLLADLKVQGLGALHEYDDADATIRARLRELWVEHEAELRRRLEGVGDDSQHAYGTMDRFEHFIGRVVPATFEESGQSPQRYAGTMVQALHHWWKWAIQLVPH